MRFTRSLGAALLWLIAAACSKDVGAPEPVTSFSRIQSEVFDVSCVGCHSSGTQDALRSGLVLEAGSSYANLVGALSTNADAKADRLRRVVPFKPDSSLLFHKLSWNWSHPGRDYGSPMPLGGSPLSVGQVEYVRRWIAAGAPRDGDSIDVNLLVDRTAQDLTPFVPLAPPTRGLQLKIESFGIAPHFERELFVRRSLGNTSDIFVNRMETAMRSGSHHFVIYDFDKDTPAFAVPSLDATVCQM
jgi:hypothetical protein